ncbi:MAG: Fibronectin type III domain protein [Parcubacteria group bacterium GW2011_GWA2_53_21]|nr:MAG: Fibronectin type III domain protein [Parcubacteria group bacterium GW2011_GWA2_53_21]
MFEDQPKSAGGPPANLPTEPVDMFAGVEESAEVAPPKMPDALSSGLLKRKSAEIPKPAAVAPLPSVGEEATAVPATSFSATAQPILGKILLVILILAALGGIGWGGWWLYANYIAKKAPIVPAITETPAPIVRPPPPAAATPAAPAPAAPPASDQPLVSETPTSTIMTKIKNDAILFGEPVDSDKDGLDDVREKEIGADQNNPDTDGDGLNDGDEVLAWKTNPLNSDTDGDSYLDGAEVKNGYNPLGRGRLLLSPTSTVPAGTP